MQMLQYSSVAEAAEAAMDGADEVAVQLNQSGWAQVQVDMDLPCRCEHWSYSYRDIEGTAFNNATPKTYAAPYTSGDVIGLLDHLAGRSA